MKRLFGAGLLAAVALFMLLGYLGSDVENRRPVAAQLALPPEGALEALDQK